MDETRSYDPSADAIWAVKKAILIYFKEKYPDSLPRVGISILRCKTSAQKITLEPGETIDDLCISVGWQGELPKEECLPQRGKDVDTALGRIRIMYDGKVDIPRAF